MNIHDTFPHLLLKVLRRKIYPALFSPYERPKLDYLQGLDSANQLLYNLLSDNHPCMIARFGSYELYTVINYLYVTGEKTVSILDYIRGRGWEWWWNKHTLENMTNNAGFWPATEENASRYAELCLADSCQADVLGSYTGNEYMIIDYLKNATFVPFFNLEPFFCKYPWTRALKGKKVLVVHPFTDTITRQYANNRNRIFANPHLLPEFDLKTFRAVQSLGGNEQFGNWFQALDYMKDGIDQIDYDIAIIGCGAYGFNLAAHIKRMGKKAIHFGGATQLLFGIIGSRWEIPNQEWYKHGNYPDLMNEYWCRPDGIEQTKALKQVENACYV